MVEHTLMRVPALGRGVRPMYGSVSVSETCYMYSLWFLEFHCSEESSLQQTSRGLIMISKLLCIAKEDCS
jgi:hypothetical protein